MLGVRVWGSPVTASRVEAYGKRYYSDSFERTTHDRTRIWESIPDDGIDVLITHSPPTFADDQLTARVAACGCEKLASRVLGMRHPPRFHCFGHDHDYFGIAQNGKTTFLNAAQCNCSF